MHSILRHGFAVVLIASASSPALAGLPANYQATFALSPGIFGGLKQATPTSTATACSPVPGSTRASPTRAR